MVATNKLAFLESHGVEISFGDSNAMGYTGYCAQKWEVIGQRIKPLNITREDMLRLVAYEFQRRALVGCDKQVMLDSLKGVARICFLSELPGSPEFGLEIEGNGATFDATGKLMLNIEDEYSPFRLKLSTPRKESGILSLRHVAKRCFFFAHVEGSFMSAFDCEREGLVLPTENLWLHKEEPIMVLRSREAYSPPFLMGTQGELFAIIDSSQLTGCLPRGDAQGCLRWEQCSTLLGALEHVQHDEEWVVHTTPWHAVCS